MGWLGYPNDDGGLKLIAALEHPAVPPVMLGAPGTVGAGCGIAAPPAAEYAPHPVGLCARILNV